MKKFWKKSFTLLAALGMVGTSIYPVIAEGTDLSGGETEAGEQTVTEEENSTVSAPQIIIKAVPVSGESVIGDAVSIDPSVYAGQTPAENIAPEVSGYVFNTAFITREGNSDTVISFGPESYITDGDEEVFYNDTADEANVVDAVFSYALKEAEPAPAEQEEETAEAAGSEKEGEEPAEDEISEMEEITEIISDDTAQSEQDKNETVLLGETNTDFTIEFLEEDGTTRDTAASVGNVYYVAVHNGNDVRAVAKVQPDNNGIAKLSFGTADTTGCGYTLVKYTGAEDLTKEYASSNWYYDGSGAMTKPSDFGGYSYERVDDRNYKAVKKPVYEVEYLFPGGAADSIGSGYSLYAAVKAVNQSGNSVTYYTSESVTLDGITEYTVPVSTFSRSNDTPIAVSYTAGMDVEIKLVKNLQIEQNDENRGTISGGDIVKNGDVISGYIVSISSSDNKTTFTFTKPEPYKYSIAVADDGKAVAFDDAYTQYWYFLSTLTKPDGKKYYYMTPVALNGATRIPETGTNSITSYRDKTDAGKTSVYQSGDTVTNELVHVSSATESYTDIIDGNNNNREAFGNESAANRYKVSSTSEDSTGTITLTKIPDLKIKTEFREADGSAVTKVPSDYRLLVKMVRDGKSYYALHTVTTGSGLSEPIVFYELNGQSLGTTPYYYSGSETVSTQVVTGTNDLLTAITSTDASIVRYNENTIRGTQNSDLTKDLFSSSSVIADGIGQLEMTTTFTRKKDDGKNHDISVSFYKKHEPSISQAELNPAVGNMDTAKDAYFFRVRLYNNNKLVAYRIEPVSQDDAAAANSAGTFTHTISGETPFQLVDDKGADIKDGSLHYDPTMYTSDVRLYKANTAEQIPASLDQVSSMGTDTLDGYDFWQNVYSEQKEGDVITGTKTDIALYAAYKKKYQVTVVVDPAADPSGIILYAEAVHKTTNIDKITIEDISAAESFRTERAADGKKLITYLLEDQTSNTFNWTTHPEGNVITGNEKFTLKLTQSGKEVKEGYPVKIGNNYYTASYDTGRAEGTNVDIDDTGKVTVITHFVRLTEASYDDAITPYDVLGEGAEYGVVANEFIRNEHSETNFAVNKYTEDTVAGIDLAANGGVSEIMPFYAGEYNKIHFTSKVYVDPDIHTPSNKENPYIHKASDEAEDKIHQDDINACDVTVIPTSRENVKAYVDGLIAKLKDSSITYRNKPSVKMEYDSQRTIDTTSFPDNKTIYIDATNLDFSSPGWNIKKLEGQTIVFNIPGNKVTLAKEVVSVYRRNENGGLDPVVENLDSNTGGNGGDPEQNSIVETHILDHVVFNAYEATRVEFESGPAGLFLAPNAYVEEVSGSGTGWVATGNTFKQTSSEWHFFRTQRRYKGDTTLGIIKALGADSTWPKGNRPATFKLSQLTEGAPMPALGAETITLTSAGKGMFGAIIWSAADVNKTYQYKISETSNWEGGWTKSGDVTVNVTVEERDGRYIGTVTYSPENDTITNTYTKGTTSKAVSVKKILSGRDWKDTDSFEFTLAAAANNSEGATLPSTVKKSATKNAQTVTFDPITFTKAGTYKFTITETKGNTSGVTYDTGAKEITITVTNDGTGALTATADPESGQVEVTNTYSAGGDTVLKITKAVSGSDWPKDKSAVFTLTAKTEGAPMPATGGETVTLTSAGEGTFGSIAWSAENVGKTYEYTISETSDWGNGWTKSADVTATVEVTDNGSGSYIGTVTYTNNDKVTNTYTAGSTEKAVSVKKILSGREWNDSDSFEFTLAAVKDNPDGAKLPSTVKKSATKSEQTVTFDPITFTKAGTYKFTITETEGKTGGMTYDTGAKEITITVTDDGSGTLVAAADPESGQVEVTNTYTAGSTKKAVSVKKVLSGREWSGSDSFEFTLAADENNPEGAKLPSAVKKSATKKNQTVTFDPITFTKAGTYKFTITETEGKTSGVTYDTDAKEITITVTDDGSGTLSAKADPESAQVEVTNLYAEETAAVGFILKVDRSLTEANPVPEEGVQFQVYNDEFTKEDAVPTDKRMLFRKVGRDSEGTNVYEFVRIGSNNVIAGENTEGDTLETGRNGMIKITGIKGDMKLTAVETKNLPGYASYKTNVPTPIMPVKEETTAEQAYESVKTSGHYFIDAPVSTAIHVIKNYADGNTRHPKDSVEVTLYKIIGDREEAVTTAVLNADNGWKVDFTDLRMRDDVGNLVKYQVRETKGGEGYTISYSPSNIAQLESDSKFKDITVTNTKEEKKPKESEKPHESEAPKIVERKKSVPNTSDNFNSVFWLSTLLVSAAAGSWAAVTLHRSR